MSNTNYEKKEKLLKICFSAMFAALICVATMVIRIPSPLGGYLNFGDCFILVAAWVLGPVYGFAAGGIGSAIADLIGYPSYAPGTFVIKGCIALAAALIAHAVIKKNRKFQMAGFTLGAVAGELIMVAGYYLFESVIMRMGFIATLENLPANFIQGAAGVVFGVIVIQIIAKTKILKNFNAYAV